MRIKEIDIARGFTVFIMPAVHVLLINSSLITQTSLLGKLLAFLAEGPGAQLFMLLMGMSFTLSKKKNLKNVLKKGTTLFVAAYFLNFLKFDIPILAGFMPVSFLNDLNLKNNTNGMLQLFLLGDILQLAGISFLIIGLIYQLPKYHLWTMLFCFAIMFVSPLQFTDTSKNFFLQYGSNLLFANNGYVYFPVFPWLCYPLAGLCLGYYLHINVDFFLLCRNTGVILMAAGKLLCLLELTGPCDNFYKTGAGGTLFHLGFAIFWLYLVHIAVKYFPYNYFYKLLSWLSYNITVVYFIQWLFIFWMIKIIGYHQLNIIPSVIYMVTVSVLVFGLTYLFNFFFRI